MLQLRQQRRLAAAEALNLPAAAGSADSSASSNPANQFYSVSNGNNDVDSSGISSSVDTPLLPHQQLNIVGPPERSPTLDGRGVATVYEDRALPRPDSALAAEAGRAYSSSGVGSRSAMMFQSGITNGDLSAPGVSPNSNLQLRRISRLSHNTPSSVTLATNGGDAAGRASANSAANSGIFEESVQRVTLAVGEAGEGVPGVGDRSESGGSEQPGQQQHVEQQQEEEEDDEMVEDIMREMMENDNGGGHRYHRDLKCRDFALGS